MEIVAQALSFVIFLFLMVLLGRVILSYVMLLSRTWRPQGFMLVVSEAVFTITDPPIKLLRRVIPPLQLGHARLDLSVLVLFIACSILSRVLLSFI